MLGVFLLSFGDADYAVWVLFDEFYPFLTFLCLLGLVLPLYCHSGALYVSSVVSLYVVC